MRHYVFLVLRVLIHLVLVGRGHIHAYSLKYTPIAEQVALLKDPQSYLAEKQELEIPQPGGVSCLLGMGTRFLRVQDCLAKLT